MANVERCTPCRLTRKTGCNANCPTRIYFEDELDFRRIVHIFGYDHMRLWMLEALAVSAEEGARCAQGIIWEANSKYHDHIHGAHGLFLNVQNERT
ncbi:hypothetical protein A2U01_0053145, partial [Trifolium medium]|nr:hypothetical protein [Trifolium medium]